MPHYVVWLGHKNGIYDTWDECQKQISGFKGGIYKKFELLKDAETAFRSHPDKYVKMNTSAFTKEILKANIKSLEAKKDKKVSKAKNKKKSGFKQLIGMNIENAICVDGSCLSKLSNGFGRIEYRGVSLANEEVIFSSKVFPEGTNNIAEFLAIVDCIRYVKENNLPNPIIFSDSVNAISWVYNKTYNTNLIKTYKTQELFDLMDDAIQFLKENTIDFPILKWQTKIWGENPADYGRKSSR